MYLTKACEETKDFILALSFFIDDLKYLNNDKVNTLLRQYDIKCVNYEGHTQVNIDFKDTMK